MLYRGLRAVVNPVVKVLWRPRIEGRENVPPTGPVIIASNHLSFIDSVLIPLMAPRQVCFLAKDEYFVRHGIKGRVQKLFFEGIGSVPVNRDAQRSAVASLQQALDVLEQGLAFGIYPEGTRSRDGRLYRGRTGVGYLALTGEALVVPVGLVGTDKVMKPGHRLPRLARMTVRFGEPLDFSALYGQAGSNAARREVTDTVMAAIRALSGQELAGTYNSRPEAA